jgi:hypothetical protein
MKKRTTEESVRLGLYLRSQKDILPHGQFQAWVEKEFGFHPTTANRIMRQSKDAVRVYDSMRNR